MLFFFICTDSSGLFNCATSLFLHCSVNLLLQVFRIRGKQRKERKPHCPHFCCLTAAEQPVLVSEVLHWSVFKYLAQCTRPVMLWERKSDVLCVLTHSVTEPTLISVYCTDPPSHSHTVKDVAGMLMWFGITGAPFLLNALKVGPPPYPLCPHGPLSNHSGAAPSPKPLVESRPHTVTPNMFGLCRFSSRLKAAGAFCELWSRILSPNAHRIFREEWL